MEKDECRRGSCPLAQDTDLDVFRLLVQAGQEGCRPARIANALKIEPNLSPFIRRLRAAGLSQRRRDGRSMIYCGALETLNALLGYLTENCCKESGRSLRHGDLQASAFQRGGTPRCLRREEESPMKRIHFHVAVEVSRMRSDCIRRVRAEPAVSKNPTMPNGCSLIRASTSRCRERQQPGLAHYRHPGESQDEIEEYTPVSGGGRQIIEQGDP